MADKDVEGDRRACSFPWRGGRARAGGVAARPLRRGPAPRAASRRRRRRASERRASPRRSRSVLAGETSDTYNRRRIALPRRRGARCSLARAERPRAAEGGRGSSRIDDATAAPFTRELSSASRRSASPSTPPGAPGRSAPAARSRRCPATSGRIRARPRPHRPLARVPAAQAQDAGLHPLRGRPLPHAPDAHDRGLADRPQRRARARPERGPRRGDRARARPRAHALRPLRRARARPAAPREPSRGRRLQAQLPVRPRRRPAREALRGAGPEPHARRPRRDPQAHDLEGATSRFRSTSARGCGSRPAAPSRRSSSTGPTRSRSRPTTSRTAFRWPRSRRSRSWRSRGASAPAPARGARPRLAARVAHPRDDRHPHVGPRRGLPRRGSSAWLEAERHRDARRLLRAARPAPGRPRRLHRDAGRRSTAS